MFKPIITTLCILSSLTLGNAAMLLDFGPVFPEGDELLSSPAHQVGALGPEDSHWNVIGRSNDTIGTESDLVYSNGAAATGVSLTYGRSAIGGKVLAFDGSNGTISSSNALGVAFSQGQYAGNVPGKDGLFSGTSAQDISIGVRIDGLSAGSYELYLVGRNTNTSQQRTMDVFVSILDASTLAYDFSDAQSKTILNEGQAGPDSEWSEGATYVSWLVDLSEGDSIFIAFDGRDGGNDTRGFMNAIQIVPVPEPSTVALLGGLASFAAAVLVRRRRK